MLAMVPTEKCPGTSIITRTGYISFQITLIGVVALGNRFAIIIAHTEGHFDAENCYLECSEHLRTENSTTILRMAIRGLKSQQSWPLPLDIWCALRLIVPHLLLWGLTLLCKSDEWSLWIIKALKPDQRYIPPKKKICNWTTSWLLLRLLSIRV